VAGLKGDPAPSPFADHDHIRAEALSGQREQVRGDKKAGMTRLKGDKGIYTLFADIFHIGILTDADYIEIAL